jgi:hypothetical protein
MPYITSSRCKRLHKFRPVEILLHERGHTYIRMYISIYLSIYMDLLLLQLSPEEVRVTRHLCVCACVCVCVCVVCVWCVCGVCAFVCVCVCVVLLCVCSHRSRQTLTSPAPIPYTLHPTYHTANPRSQISLSLSLTHPTPHTQDPIYLVFFPLPHERACEQLRDPGLYVPPSAGANSHKSALLTFFSKYTRTQDCVSFFVCSLPCASSNGLRHTLCKVLSLTTASLSLSLSLALSILNVYSKYARAMTFRERWPP